MRLNSITHRHLSFCIVLLSWGALGVALFTQHALDMQPCPWCVAQRMLYILCGALALLAALVPVGSTATRLLAGFFLAHVLLLAEGALATALYQHLVAAATDSCGITAVDRLLASTGLADWMPAVFQPQAACNEADQPLLGLPYSLWSAMLASLLIMLTLVCLSRLVQAHRPF